ncbi:hypothetical protein [Streptomyces smyrnaeus]|uniref:hypothetical protein n=1 Tax=Streptomyces smyrnaeus TaxID=1387713 RepID=UPI0036C0A38F
MASVGAVASAAQLTIGVTRRGWLTLNHQMQILALLVVTAVIAVFVALRERQQREMTQVRSVSEAVQRVLLRPLPPRLGPLRVASVYLAAEAEAQVGGDLFAAARTQGRTGTASALADCEWVALALGSTPCPGPAPAPRGPSRATVRAIHRPARIGQRRKKACARSQGGKSADMARHFTPLTRSVSSGGSRTVLASGFSTL